MDEERHLGRTIRDLRERRKLNQTELAEGAGVSLLTSSRIVRGEHDPHLKTLARLSAVLGVSIVDLLRSSGYSEVGDIDPEG